MLRVEGLQFKRGDEVLFKDLSFVVHAGQTVGVAGRNGVGKSTLFKLLQGHLGSDVGDIFLPNSWRIAHLAQEVAPTQRSAIDYVIDGHRQLRKVQARIQQLEQGANDSANAETELAHLHSDLADLNGYEAEANAAAILAGLGFSATDQKKPYAEFSGGWRIRLNLAQTLMTPCELLLLDEPTNHLDMETIMWLEGWIRRFEGTVLIIAHDRAFLDACTDHTLYLSVKRGTLYDGNYSSCERQRAERLAQEQSAQARQAAQAAHIQKFVDRFRAKASKAKQVQSRIKALERLQSTTTILAESPYSVAFQQPLKASNPLFSLRQLSLGYGDSTVLENISQSILPGDRVGVLGANGAGKSTLLKALVGDLPAMHGELNRGTHSAVGYFAQHQLETLNADRNALQTALKAKPERTEQQHRDYLGGWGFSADLATRPIRTLSGGEKARLVLALIAMEQPAVLVLDEPTNHLDLDMRDALAMALQDFAGAVIIVSHDRALLEKTVDELWLVRTGTVQRFDGDLDDYAGLTDEQADRAAQPAHERRLQRQQRAQQRQAEKALRDEVKKQERLLEKQTAELAPLEAQLADTETYQSMPPEELDELLRRAGHLRRKLEETEERWLAASEALEG